MSRLSGTQHYYRHCRVDLMTEYTICESLASIDSPYMVALARREPYGRIIGEFLEEQGMLRNGCSLCEVGGGYGSLMKGLLESCGHRIGRVCMVDLSLSLLARQRAVLAPWQRRILYVNADVMTQIPALVNVDTLILNEVIGDLDTWEDLDAKSLPDEASRLIDRYDLEIPGDRLFNFNIGAIRLVEEICRKRLPAFISEHSCDCIVPKDMEYLLRGLESSGFPRKISLTGHSEFTIRFSHLIRVAEYWGRTVRTGSLAELVGIRHTPRMNFIFTAGACGTDEQEIIYELLDNIREYRWLLIG